MSELIYLSDRRVVSIGGKDKEEFLQGLITNDINKLKDSASIFACLLTPQGKFLCDFFLYKKDGEILIDINEAFVESFLKKLKIYRLRSDVEFKEENYFIYADLSGKENKESYKDPRNKILGNRILSIEKLETVGLSDYKKFQIDNAIADGCYDLTIEKSFILEFGYDKLNAINFDKGCYVGQEVITRTYRRGVIRKAVNKLKILPASNNIKNGDEILYEGKKLGIILSSYKDSAEVIALALIRKENIESNIELICNIDDQEVEIKIF